MQLTKIINKFQKLEQEVSIPQAVGVVATPGVFAIDVGDIIRFNTASGRCCCNPSKLSWTVLITAVSIPQAVGVVATHAAVSVIIHAT